METKTMFYIGGVIIFIKGLLVFNGVNLPKRDGTIIENPINYSIETMLIGVAVIIVTYIISHLLKRKDIKDNDD